MACSTQFAWFLCSFLNGALISPVSRVRNSHVISYNFVHRILNHYYMYVIFKKINTSKNATFMQFAFMSRQSSKLIRNINPAIDSTVAVNHSTSEAAAIVKQGEN